MASTSNLDKGIAPMDAVRQMTGLEVLTAWKDGAFPAPAIGKLLGFSLKEVERGRVVFEGRPGPQHYNPLGIVHGGLALTLLDSCTGCAIHTMLDKATTYTTVETKVNFVRSMTDKTGVVYAEGKTIHVGSRIATAEGRIVDSAGKLLAHGTTTCLIMKI
jgi:uncharacterized protein (TIGR00369 family)